MWVDLEHGNCMIYQRLLIIFRFSPTKKMYIQFPRMHEIAKQHAFKENRLKRMKEYENLDYLPFDKNIQN